MVTVVAAVLAGTTIVGCTTPPARLSECTESGTARFRGIPIASQQEHARATQFLPSSANACVVYVLRGRDLWTGTKVRAATIILTEKGFSMPRFPAHPSQLPSVLGDRVLAIDDDVYAMWEVPSGSYLLRAFFIFHYGGVFISQAQGKPDAGPQTSRELKCAAGEARFYDLEDRGFSDYPELTELAPARAKERVRSGLRSAGYFLWDGLSYRDCQLKW
jgi:hypothetical protein